MRGSGIGLGMVRKCKSEMILGVLLTHMFPRRSDVALTARENWDRVVQSRIITELDLESFPES